MAQFVNLRSPFLSKTQNLSCLLGAPPRNPPLPASSSSSWTSLQRTLCCNGRISCLFSSNRKQEEARKALESALGEKKTEFEKWDKEIKKREEAGGGGNSGGGGWFGWFGGSNGDHFWQEAQQASLAILGIIVVYLVVAKGDVILAVIFNPLLFALRGTRTGLTSLTSKIMNKRHPTKENCDTPQEEVTVHLSAKERVARKWGNS